MKNKIHNLNIFVIMLVVLYSISINKLLSSTNIDKFMNYSITFLTSLGFYRLFIILLYSIINNFDVILKIYWRKLYLKGYWYYTYTLDGRIYYGIWKIEQDIYGIVINGFGIDEDGKQRSDVRSVTQLIENNHAYDIVNSRRDLVDFEKDNYSKTTLHPDTPKKNSLFSINVPNKMRAVTYLYGGRLSGIIHKDVVFRKLNNAFCEDDVINYLNENVIKKMS